MARKLEINPGDRFGYLEIIKEVEKKNKSKRRFLCKCLFKNCGNEVEVDLILLTTGKTKSCGCFQKYPDKNPNFKHGFANHPLYQIWLAIKKRCYYKKAPQYKDYGGREIKVCDEWLDNPKNFVEWGLSNGWRKNLQIDRINNDGDYEPNNCRFVTPQENSLNQRLLKSNNKSGYRGVSFNKEKNVYIGQLVFNNKLMFNKSFKTAKEAAIYRDEFIIRNNLPHPLNFPELKNE